MLFRLAGEKLGCAAARLARRSLPLDAVPRTSRQDVKSRDAPRRNALPQSLRTSRGKILEARARAPSPSRRDAWCLKKAFSTHYPFLILYKGHLHGQSKGLHVVKRIAFAMLKNVACPQNDLACLQLAQCLTHACPTLGYVFHSQNDLACLQLAQCLSHALVVDTIALNVHYLLHTSQ